MVFGTFQRRFVLTIGPYMLTLFSAISLHKMTLVLAKQTRFSLTKINQNSLVP